ncbi:Uncharacterized mitochondrial protein AtMg00810 [Striga hermonthica]|uniref:Uncharacterized mitochondrial protein AtMg00810 n=1 Tax=Striga hermonthica TaxID=68872 RepID=A0A9N7MMJ8_STRHE|nr:Uncharacterized mitochondrial protein AtMg00810 [Striga hermonthica]
MAGVPYSSAVGSLMYAMVCTRPDIAHAVGIVSRYLSNPGKDHWEAVKWILRYLKGSANKSLSFDKGNTVLEGYTDADMAGDLDSRKSTSRSRQRNTLVEEVSSTIGNEGGKTLEGTASGVPMLTWPVFADGLCNEKFNVFIGEKGGGGVQVKSGVVKAAKAEWNYPPVIDQRHFARIH